MQSIQKLTRGRRRHVTSTVAALAAVGVAALTAVSIPAEAATASDFRTPVFIASGNVKSIFFSARGFSRWRAGSETGSVGSLQEPASLSVCYTYRGDRATARVQAVDMYAFINEAPGSQDETFTRENAQGSNPTFIVGSPFSVITFKDKYCTVDPLMESGAGNTIPNSSGLTFDLILG